MGNVSLPENSGYIICSNHLKAIDPVLIGCFMKRKMRFMGKKELFKIPILSWIFKQLGGFPVDRGKGDLIAIKTAVEILKSNNVMTMFPEGTRSKTGELGEFKKGAVLIASRANVPIVPVKISGNYKLFSRMTLTIGKPIYITKENRNTATEELYKVIEKM